VQRPPLWRERPQLSKSLGNNSRQNENITFSEKELDGLHYELEPSAKAFAENPDPDILDVAKNSKNFRHRIALAWSFGKRGVADTMLFDLLTDENPVVVYAAKNSCKMIAQDVYGKILDFGPHFDATQEEKADSRALWEITLKKYKEIIDKELAKSDKEGAVKKVGNTIKPPPPKKKTPQEILGIE